MPPVRTQMIDDVRFLGGIFQDVENGFREADYEGDLAKYLPRLRNDHANMFTGQHDSSGRQWKPLSPSTIKKKGHSLILWETGRLAGSLTGAGGGDQIAATSHRGLKFGTRDEKAPFHQEGTAKMPARPPVGLTEETLDKITESIADAAVETMKGP